MSKVFAFGLTPSIRIASLSSTSPAHVCSPRRSLPRASLAAELVFKALEVGAATVATQAAVSSVGSRPSSDLPVVTKKRGLFSGRGRNRTAAKANQIAQNADAAATATSGADAIRAFVEEALRPRGDINGTSRSQSRGKNGSTPNNASVEALMTSVAGVLQSITGAAQDDRWIKLSVCILIDLVGSGSLAVPLVGDVLDVATAPVAALLLQGIFRNPLITAASLAEELLPGTDAIPTATLAWLGENSGYFKVPGSNDSEDVEKTALKSKRAPMKRKAK